MPHKLGNKASKAKKGWLLPACRRQNTRCFVSFPHFSQCRRPAAYPVNKLNAWKEHVASGMQEKKGPFCVAHLRRRYIVSPFSAVRTQPASKTLRRSRSARKPCLLVILISPCISRLPCLRDCWIAVESWERTHAFRGLRPGNKLPGLGMLQCASYEPCHTAVRDVIPLNQLDSYSKRRSPCCLFPLCSPVLFPLCFLARQLVRP